MKKRVLLVMNLPPPLHGTTMMNSYILEILGKMSDVEVRLVRLQYARDVSEMGRFSPGKVLTTLKVCCRLVVEALFFRPAFFYFPMSPFGKAFYRDLLLGLTLRIFAVPGLYQMHAKGLKSHETNAFLAWCLRRLFSRSRVICLSPRLYYDVAPYCAESRMISIPNGIKPTLSQEVERSPSEEGSRPVRILFLAHLWPSKGFADLLEAGLILEQERVPFELHFVGGWGGEDQKARFLELQNRFVEPDRVVYHGPLYDEDKRRVLSDSDVLAFPTTNDAFGLVLVEAMEFSLAVVATLEGAIPDVVADGDSGFIIERRNPKMLAKRLGQLIGDPDLRVRMGKAGRKRFLDRFTFARYEQDVTRTFRDALDSEEFFEEPAEVAGCGQAAQATAVASKE